VLSSCPRRARDGVSCDVCFSSATSQSREARLAVTPIKARTCFGFNPLVLSFHALSMEVALILDGKDRKPEGLGSVGSESPCRLAPLGLQSSR
jgi:hypothetical protein